ncbi:MAG: TfoX/Sxy family protein [Proteobacteria bacterium]|nr:TfoX/Sxy family protein [Pseudomonadota bacterium]
MCCGPNGSELMVRVGKEAWAQALTLEGAREMDFTAKSLKGFVWVAAEALEDDEALEAWVERGLDFVGTLPPK